MITFAFDITKVSFLYLEGLVFPGRISGRIWHILRPEVIILEKYTDKTYKKYTLGLLIITVAALIVCAAALTLKRDAIAVQGRPEQNYTSYYSPKPSASQENGEAGASSFFETEKPTKPKKSSAVKSESYLITIYNGKIGVYKDNEGKPFITADIDVYLLPDEDIAILRKGLKADSFSEVKRILEDYE